MNSDESERRRSRRKLANLWSSLPSYSKWWIAYGLVVAALVFGATAESSTDVRSAAEALALGMIVLGLAAHPTVASTLRGTPSRWRWLVACVVALVLVSHVIKVSRYTFPFVDWRMFGRSASGPAQVLHLEAYRADGTKERVVPGAIISDATVSRLDAMIRTLSGSTLPEDKRKLEEVLKAVAALHQAFVPGAPIVAVEVGQCTIPLEHPSNGQCVAKQSVDFNGGAGNHR